jgi:hypothetical protein
VSQIGIPLQALEDFDDIIWSQTLYHLAFLARTFGVARISVLPYFQRVALPVEGPGL